MFQKIELRIPLCRGSTFWDSRHSNLYSRILIRDFEESDKSNLVIWLCTTLKNPINKCFCFVSLTLFRYKRNCIFMYFLALPNLFSRKRARLPILSASLYFIPLINSKAGFFVRLYCLNLCGTETWCRNYLWIWSSLIFIRESRLEILGEVIIFCRQNNSDKRSVQRTFVATKLRDELHERSPSGNWKRKNVLS